MFQDRRKSLILIAILVGLAVCVVSVQAACDKGCDCLTPTEAKKLGYEYCGGARTSCGTSLLEPKYCYGTPSGEPPVTVTPDRTIQPCLPGWTSCGGRCVDTRTSSSHCGSCNYACPAGSTCQGGTCVCNTGLTACSLDSFSPTSKTSPKNFICADLKADESNCGACGKVCDSREYCDEGECLPRLEGMICKTGHQPCSGVCVDLLEDEDNCGRCGNACGSGQTCTEGSCVTSATGAVQCPSGCECLTNDGAAEMFGGGSYTLCSEVQEPCGFEVHAEPSFVSSTVVPKYCFKKYADCSPGCGCLLPGEASAEEYTLCGGVQTVCGAQWVGSGSPASVKADILEKYCYLLRSPESCPESCSCMDPAKASGMGYPSCGEEEIPCDSDSQGRPYYCYKTAGERPEHCANGCSCLNATKARAEGYTYCGGEQTVCGKDPAGNPRHCVEKLVPEAPVQAPQACAPGCSCRAPDEAGAAGYVSCGRTQTLCGYDEGNPLYCYSPGVPPAQSSAFPERVISIKDSILRRWIAPARGISVRDILGSIFGGRCFPPMETRCSGACVDIQTDEANCGTCGTVCLSGYDCCSGSCVNLATSESHCAGCGNACDPGETCCPSSSGGFSYCTNTLTDESNCGGCGNACLSIWECNRGRCIHSPNTG